MISPELIPEPHRVLADLSLARVCRWGVREYGKILELQQRLHGLRVADSIPDTWLAGEHFGVITQGVRGEHADLLKTSYNIPVFQVGRGGQTTLHNPGQLVLYPIARTQPGVLAQARASKLLLLSVREWLRELTGLELEAPRGRPGLFLGAEKIAAIGISIRGQVTMHGIAINCSNPLDPWRAIVPCGEPDTRPQTLSHILGRTIEPGELIAALPKLLIKHWGYAALISVDCAEICTPTRLEP